MWLKIYGSNQRSFRSAYSFGGRGHKGLYNTINNSIHFQLGHALASLGVITSLVAQHMYSLPAYAFIAQDFTTQAALYTHHQYIAGFIMIGAFAHGAIFSLGITIRNRMLVSIDFRVAVG
jgi:hypothetical protein